MKKNTTKTLLRFSLSGLLGAFALSVFAQTQTQVKENLDVIGIRINPTVQGGCQLRLPANQALQSERCAGDLLTLDCNGHFRDSQIGTDMLRMSQIAMALGLKLAVEIDAEKSIDEACYVAGLRIDTRVQDSNEGSLLPLLQERKGSFEFFGFSKPNPLDDLHQDGVNRVFRDADSWQVFQDELLENKRESEVDEFYIDVADVNFDTEMIILFLRPSLFFTSISNISANISDINEYDEKIVVNQNTYTCGYVLTMIWGYIQPYHAVVVPRSNKPVEFSYKEIYEESCENIDRWTSYNAQSADSESHLNNTQLLK